MENPYGYDRAFSYSLCEDDGTWLKATLSDSLASFMVLDPTAGGGSIPFETIRLGLAPLANDLNPVAALIMKATVE